VRGLWPRKHPPVMPDKQCCTAGNRIAAQALYALPVDCLVNATNTTMHKPCLCLAMPDSIAMQAIHTFLNTIYYVDSKYCKHCILMC